MDDVIKVGDTVQCASKGSRFYKQKGVVHHIGYYSDTRPYFVLEMPERNVLAISANKVRKVDKKLH